MKLILQLFRICKLLVIVLIFFFLTGYAATAATTRYVKPASTGTGTGLSWANASGDLQAMITASVSGDQVWVMKGIYLHTHSAVTGVIAVNRSNAFVLKAGVTIYGGFLGTELSLLSRNYTSNITTLSGDIGVLAVKTDNCYHVVIAAGSISGNGRLDGFTVSDGYADLASSFTVNSTSLNANQGGGIYIAGCTASIQNCIIRRSAALNGIGGGGIYTNSGSSPLINNCMLNNNSTTGSTCNGAGIYMESASATISNCSFTNNTSSHDGGGIYITTTAAPTITDCNFTGNTSSHGGGICNFATSVFLMSGCNFNSNVCSFYGGGMYNSSSSPSMINCQFNENAANDGAGLYNSLSSASINNCSFSGNTVDGSGAGMFNQVSSPTIINCSFLGNQSGFNGAGMKNAASSSPTITNCVFSGNITGAAIGGGIDNSSSSPTIVNCTFSGNVGDGGGGAIGNTSSNPIIKNSIFWGNANRFFVSVEITNISSTPTISYTIIQFLVAPGIGNSSSDPLFINPQPASAAPTTAGNYRLQRCSPAINTGLNSNNTSAFDLDNNLRVNYVTIDKGAYEKFLAVPDASGIVYVDSSNTLSEGDGSSWPNAVTQLADALKAAKTNTAIQQIWVAAGTYKPLYNGIDNGSFLSCPATNRDNAFVLVNNVKIYGGFAGGETTLTARNLLNNPTILSGDIGVANDNTDNCYHVAIGSGAVGNAALDGLTISNGNANGNTDGFGYILVNTNHIYRSDGAGLNNYTSSPLINGCNFSGNTSDGRGGAIFNIFSSSPTIMNCNISGNKAWTGGGVSNENLSSPSIINCTITANQGALFGGPTGGIDMDIPSSPVIKNCIIWGNRGVLNNIYAPPGSTPIVINNIIEGGFPAGTNIIDKDPLFLNPQLASAAPTTLGDYRLHPCSPAVNTGDNTYATTLTDLDDNPRIVNTTVDLGAYEVQQGAAVSLTPTANIIYVDNTKYGDGSSWATPLHFLGDALKAAITNTTIQQIWVRKGTQYPLYDAATLSCFPADNRDKSFVLVNNVKVYGGFAGGETSTAGRNFITNETILSADMGVANNITDNCYHVVVSAGVVGTATLDGFTITKGNANGAGNITVNGNISDRVRGAGITNLSSSPAISNCVVSSNTASGGAAIGNITSAPVLSNCTFSSNTASNSGGVIDNYLNSAVSITNCVFSGNSAGFGGAIMNSGGSSLTMKNSMLSGNTATDGGAFYNQAATTATIINCVFKGNKASNGAAFYFNNSSPQIINCTIAANLASVNGGGILNNNASPAITNSIIWANKAASNNNISVLTGIPVITNSIIEGGFTTGTNIINSDPLFLSPQPATSAPTTLGDYHVQACSPAINYGDNSTVTALTDLDANTRIKFTDVDLGAYEVQTQDLTQSTWRGINTNWNDKVNWCGGYIPLATTDISIPSGLTNYPTTALTNSVKNISLANNTSVTVSATGSLSVNGTYSNTGSTIINNGNWIMTGSSAGQSFPGTTATVAAMNNLEINNPSGITFNKSFSITGSLIPTAGNINLNNVDITLKSSATATASVAIIQPAASITHTGTGSFIVERFINTGTNTAIGQHVKSWQFLATPVNGQTIFQSWQEGGTIPAGFGTIITGTGTGFDITTLLPSMKFYDDNLNSWTAVTNTGNALPNKNGYMLYVRGDRTVTTSAGAPNNTTLRSKGTIFTTTNPPPPVVVQANKFQAVGNPYSIKNCI